MEFRMSGSLNKVTLIGNLGSDPEIKAMQNGDKIVNLSIATSDRWKDKTTGEQRERTEWHRVVIFNDALGRIAEQYLKKGSTIYIEGQLQTRKWTDQQSGQEKYTTEVVLQRYRGEITMLGARPDNSFSNQSQSSVSNQSQSSNEQSNFQETNQNQVSNIASDLDDEIPF
jgi:single-strand DNA-binding protein|tara:strand:+ start:65 stop:574 length:510 start_codon:yes stop_codon:yes gene_type:complete